MKVVWADPGMSNLLYFGSYSKEDKLETFWYTQNQRRLGRSMYFIFIAEKTLRQKTPQKSNTNT
jgi:hypothetical protein